MTSSEDTETKAPDWLMDIFGKLTNNNNNNVDLTKCPQ